MITGNLKRKIINAQTISSFGVTGINVDGQLEEELSIDNLPQIKEILKNNNKQYILLFNDSNERYDITEDDSEEWMEWSIQIIENIPTIN